MTRTRLRQVEQINNTSLYSDILHQGTNTGTATEGQPLDTIATGIVCNISGTTVTINSNDLTSLGVNVEDIIEVGSEQIDISNISVVSGNTTITLVSAPSAQSSQTITIKVNPVKSLDRDLNHVRTQLKKLNHANHWWNNPTMNGVSMFSSQTRTAIFAGELIDVGGIYNAGDPFDLNIYLNGELIQASIVINGIITESYDYQEVDDSGNPVGIGNTSRNVTINFDIVTGDVLQFIWNK